MRLNKKVVFLVFFIILIVVHTISFGKYVIEYQNIVATINIDRNPPKIEVIKIENTNKGYEQYANNTHTITTQIKIIEKNIKENNLKEENLSIYVGEKLVKPSKTIIQEVERKNDYIVYNIILEGIGENGNLKIIIPKGTIIDKSENVNEEKIIDTKITIDNIAPNGTFSQKTISQGNVLASINSNEQLREVEGWKLSDDKLVLEKSFTNNVSYVFTITDFAQNTSTVNIEILQATNIKLTYASHNSEVGWTFGYGNKDIAGKKAIIKNPKLKTEALAIRTDGDIDKDFIKVRTYVHTYWGEGAKAKCLTSGMIYSHGYNPSKTTWKTMESNDLVKIDGKEYIQFGGSGINKCKNTDINGKNPIPLENTYEYNYGISGLAIDLKNYEQYSVVYQIFVNRTRLDKDSI